MPDPTQLNSTESELWTCSERRISQKLSFDSESGERWSSVESSRTLWTRCLVCRSRKALVMTWLGGRRCRSLISAGHVGWVRLNVNSSVSDWLQQDGHQLSLRVVVSDARSRTRLNAHDVFQLPTCAQHRQSGRLINVFRTRQRVLKRYQRCSCSCCSWGYCYQIFNSLKLFHFAADRINVINFAYRWWQYFPQSYHVGFSSCPSKYV